MLSKNLAMALVLGTTAVCVAQTPSTVSEKAVKHYRLTFVITDAQGKSVPQSFLLDVPVAPGRTGISKISMVSGMNGDAQTIVQQTLECSNVHSSATGLAMDIAMESDREAPAVAGVSARHQHGVFQRKVDLVLGKPTVVTNQMHVIPLGKMDPATAAAILPPAPQITVTAVEL